MSMNAMDIELELFRRILRYWIAKHESFCLLQDKDVMSEYCSGWNFNYLYFECFKNIENPTLMVSRDAFEKYVRRCMIDRFNTILYQQVRQDVKKEIDDLHIRQLQAMSELSALEELPFRSMSEDFRYSCLSKQCLKIQEDLDHLEPIMFWFLWGNPHFKLVRFEGVSVVVQLVSR